MLFAGGFGVFQLPNPASPTIGQWTPVTGPPPQNNKISARVCGGLPLRLHQKRSRGWDIGAGSLALRRRAGRRNRKHSRPKQPLLGWLRGEKPVARAASSPLPAALHPVSKSRLTTYTLFEAAGLHVFGRVPSQSRKARYN